MEKEPHTMLWLEKTQQEELQKCLWIQQILHMTQ